jgi:hypothetical protein
VGWVQLPGVGKAEVARCRNVELEASVVVGGGSNVEAIGCMWCPGCLCDTRLLYTSSLVPNGVRGVLLKSKLL